MSLTKVEQSVSSGFLLSKVAARLVGSAQTLSLLDQGLVSATSFLCLLLIAHFSDVTEVGVFAFGMSVITVLLHAQEALIIRPYIIRLHQPDTSVAQQTSHAIWLAFGLCATAASSLLVAYSVSIYAGASPSVERALLAMAFTVPCFLLKEFARKHAYARLKVRNALLVDVPACLLTLGSLALLGWNGTLTAATAIGAIGVANAVSAVVWLFRNKAMRELRPVFAWQQSWILGKWFFASQAAVQVQAYAATWMVLAIGGAPLAGIYAACAIIVGIANPLLYGVFNLLIPKSSRTLQERGVGALRSRAQRSALQLCVLMGAFCVALALCGTAIMSLLYPAEYQHQERILVTLALAAWAGALGAPASIALAAAGQVGRKGCGRRRDRTVESYITHSAFTRLAPIWRCHGVVRR